MIVKLACSYRDFCIVCRNWDYLAFRDSTLGSQGVCSACLRPLLMADSLLEHSGLKEPPPFLVYSTLHKLF
jgi:hypothetical protein